MVKAIQAKPRKIKGTRRAERIQEIIESTFKTRTAPSIVSKVQLISPVDTEGTLIFEVWFAFTARPVSMGQILMAQRSVQYNVWSLGERRPVWMEPRFADGQKIKPLHKPEKV